MNLAGLARRNLGRRRFAPAYPSSGSDWRSEARSPSHVAFAQYQDGMREGINEMGDDLVVMQKGASDIFGASSRKKTIERVAAIPGVARASGELFMFAPSADDKSVLAQGVNRHELPLEEGSSARGTRAGSREHNVAVLGDAAAAALGKKLGDDVVVTRRTVQIIGIANYTTAVNRGVALLPLADLQKISHRPEQVTMVHLNVERSAAPVELKQVKTAIELLGNLSASTANEMLDKDRNFAILDAVSLAISLIAIIMGAIYVLNALMMATQERTREIGIFTAIGWSQRRIMASIVVEGILMCVIGCVLGLALSFLAALAFPYIPAIGNPVSFRPSIRLIVLVLLAAFVLCAWSLFPAWRFGCLPPKLCVAFDRRAATAIEPRERPCEQSSSIHGGMLLKCSSTDSPRLQYGRSRRRQPEQHA